MGILASRQQRKSVVEKIATHMENHKTAYLRGIQLATFGVGAYHAIKAKQEQDAGNLKDAMARSARAGYCFGVSAMLSGKTK